MAVRERAGRPAPAVPWRGVAVALLVATVVLIVAAIALPLLLGWDVASRAPRSADPRALPPLHGLLSPRVGPASVLVAALALAAAIWAPRLALTLRWPILLAAAFAAAAAWLLLLAFVDGPWGLARVLGNPFEYLGTAREVTDVGALLHGFLARVPYAADENWVTHVAGHPPGMLLFFVLLVRLGLGDDLTAGIAVALIAATLPLAVMSTLRALGAAAVARRAAPFLVFTPAAVFLAVSADAVIAAVGAWGIALLACATAARTRGGVVAWAAAAGAVLGIVVELSYGMPLLGVLALAVLLAGRRWLALPVAAASALAVVLAVAGAGFALWEAYPVIAERYADGIARSRPYEYWVWANLAALAISAGPAVAAGLGRAAVAPRAWQRAPRLLILAGVVMIVLADLSGMSKAEVERIWLPFIPWITVSLALLPGRWRRAALVAQLLWAIVVQHLLYTVW